MGYMYRRKRKKDGAVIESGPFWIKYYRNGRAFRESTETEKESDARKILRLREGDIARGVPVSPSTDRITVSELLDDLLTDYRVNDKASIMKIEGICKNHLRPAVGHRRASQITTADIRKYMQSRQEGKAGNATINRELAALKRAFNLAVQSTPPKLMHKPYVPMLEENNIRTGFFDREQFETVRAHLPEALRPVVTFAYITGWRANSEILTLKWNQVDFRAGTVRLDQGSTKNKEGRLFPFKIDAELAEVLEMQLAKTQALQKDRGMICPWVLHRDGLPIKNYYKAWKTACRQAGLPGRIPHDFRRTAVRNLERAGVSRSVAMKLTGHKTEAVYRRYAIVSEADLSEAVGKLQSLNPAYSVSVMGTKTGTLAHKTVQIGSEKKRSKSAGSD